MLRSVHTGPVPRTDRARQTVYLDEGCRPAWEASIGFASRSSVAFRFSAACSLSLPARC